MQWNEALDEVLRSCELADCGSACARRLDYTYNRKGGEVAAPVRQINRSVATL